MKMNVRTLTALAVLAAISILLVALIHFPIFPAATFLEYDPADIPIFIATFAFGPIYGLALTAVVSVIQGVTVSAASGIIGILMHLLATGSFAVVAGFIYKKNKTRKGSIIALVSGVLVMTAVMILWNVLVTPIYMGVDTQVVVDMLVPVIIPFNLLKAGINAVITMFLYKHIGKLFKRSGAIHQS